MSIKLTGDKPRVVDEVQSRLDKFLDSAKTYESALNALNELAAKRVELEDALAHEDRYSSALSEYEKASKSLKEAAEKANKKTDHDHRHKYFMPRHNGKINQLLHAGPKNRSDIHQDHKADLEAIHQETKKIVSIDFDTQVSQLKNESQRRKTEAQATLEYNSIDQTFPRCRDRLIQENPNEYLRQADLYQYKLLEQKNKTEALAFGNSWIKSLPKEATWQQVENMSFMMLEAANEQVDLSEFRSSVEQWSREHPLSDNPTHPTPDQAMTPWGRRTHLLGLLYLANQNQCPEAFELYKNCGILYPDQQLWKIAQAYHHISQLQCVEAEQLLDDLPKEDPSVIQVQKYLNVAKAEKEFSLIDQTFPNSRDELLQENPDEYLRQAALYQRKLLENKDETAALAFGNAWIKNLPKEATWEQVEEMSFIMIDAAKTNESSDLSEYRAAVQQWLELHPLPPDSVDSILTPWGQRNYVLGLLYLQSPHLDLSPEAFQVYQSCGTLCPDEHVWKVAQSRYHILHRQWIEAQQLLTGLPEDDASVRDTQRDLTYHLHERVSSAVMDIVLIAFSRLIPSAHQDTVTYDTIHTGLHLVTREPIQRMWVPHCLGMPERAIPFNQFFQLPYSTLVSIAGDVVDCIFRRVVAVSPIQRQTITGYNFGSSLVRAANTAYALYTDPLQLSIPFIGHFGSQLISVTQSFDECREIRRSPTRQAFSSTLQLMASDITSAFTIASYSDLLPVIGNRLLPTPSNSTISLAARTLEKSSKGKWFITATGIGSLVAFRFYHDYPYLWAASVMRDVEFYSSQGKYEDVQRVLTEAENCYFVSSVLPTVQDYVSYAKWLENYPMLLEDPAKSQKFLTQLDLVLNLLMASSHYRGIRKSILLKKLEIAILQKDPIRLKEVCAEDPHDKIVTFGFQFFLSYTFDLALQDPAEACALLEKMKLSFPSRFHPATESFLNLLQSQSKSLKEWPKLKLNHQNPLSSKKVQQWCNELQQLHDFFSQNGKESRTCQNLQYYKLMITFTQADTQLVEDLFENSNPELHQRFSLDLVHLTKLSRKTGNPQEAISLLRKAQIHSFRDNQLIQNYCRFFSSVYSPQNIEPNDLDNCIACLNPNDPVHQQLQVFFTACRIVFNLDAQKLLEQTDSDVLDEVAALLFERVHIAMQENNPEKALTDLRMIKNLGSWQHIELFKTYQGYLECEPSLEIRLECLTALLTQMAPIEQLSDFATHLEHDRHLLDFELQLSQGNYAAAKKLLTGPKELYSQLCNLFFTFFIHHGEYLRQNVPLSTAIKTLRELNILFDIPNYKEFQSYINFLVLLDKIAEQKDFAACQRASRSLETVLAKFNTIDCPIPESLIKQQIYILLQIAALAKSAGQREIGLAAIESIKKLVIPDEELDQDLRALKEQLNA